MDDEKNLEMNNGQRIHGSELYIGESIEKLNAVGGGGGGVDRREAHREYYRKEKIMYKISWKERLCRASILFLWVTITLTLLATILLYVALTSRYWEILLYDASKVNEIVEEMNKTNSSSVRSVQWLYGGRVPLVSYEKNQYEFGDIENNHNDDSDNVLENYQTTLYLFPIHAGLWKSCFDLNEQDFEQLEGSDRVRCVDHLDPTIPKPTETKAAWQYRMQNLAIACAIVCLILLGAAFVVGLFGLIRKQISAILVTGVIYVLAATFATFTLTIYYVKHKNRGDQDPLDVWKRLSPHLKGANEFQKARLIEEGWSLYLAWAGDCVCLMASAMWIWLSKLMQYNPFNAPITVA